MSGVARSRVVVAISTAGPSSSLRVTNLGPGVATGVSVRLAGVRLADHPSVSSASAVPLLTLGPGESAEFPLRADFRSRGLGPAVSEWTDDRGRVHRLESALG